MAADFTKDKWQLNFAQDQWKIDAQGDIRADGEIIATVYGVNNPDNTIADKCRANARLIMAAPKMCNLLLRFHRIFSEAHLYDLINQRVDTHWILDAIEGVNLDAIEILTGTSVKEIKSD